MNSAYKSVIFGNHAAIVGAGPLGREVASQIEAVGLKAYFFTGERTIECFERWLDKLRPAAVFVAISNRDTGEAAMGYILPSMKRGIPTYTCEKCSIAYHAIDLGSYLPLLGASGAAGGGSRIMKWIAEKLAPIDLDKEDVEVNVVCNATWNFHLSMMWDLSFEEAHAQAAKSGILETGSRSMLESMNAELSDVGRKSIVILIRALGAKPERSLTPERLGIRPLTQEALDEIIAKGRDYRLVVTFTNHRSSKRREYLGPHFAADSIGGWNVIGGFQKITLESQLASWLPTGLGNAAQVIIGQHGRAVWDSWAGPGAGAVVTAQAMIADFLDDLKAAK